MRLSGNNIRQWGDYARSMYFMTGMTFRQRGKDHVRQESEEMFEYLICAHLSGEWRL